MSKNPRRPNEEDLFEQAIALTSKEERDAFLLGACGNDGDLRDRIDRLLIAHEKAGGFMNSQTVIHAPLNIAPAEKPGTQIGRYKLLQKLGEGGMGAVYMAEQTEPVTRKVALKIIKLGMDTKQVVARFEAERQALALMDHPNIAKVLDAGSTDTGRPYFVMELVRGVPITEYCDKNKLSNQDRLNLFVHVCQAIQHAHQKGVIHRDIKPSNVMVTLHDGNAVPKVIDFGIAKAINQKLTEKTLFTNYAHMIGTPAYMSPEQAEMSGLDVDTRTDVYSLGVLLYELLTSRTPFCGKELMSHGYAEMQRIIAEQEPPKPSRMLGTLEDADRTIVAKNRSMEVGTLCRVFQGDLDWIVIKALEKDRSRRYDTVNGLAADIRRYQENEPIMARPPSVLYKFQKAWRRNKVVYAAAALVVFALLIGTAVSLVGLKRAMTQQKVADQKTTEAENEKGRANKLVDQLNLNLYWSLIAQAHREVERNRLSSALELLEKCSKELINWEWHYVRNRCYGSSQSSVRIPEKINECVISPSGRDFATLDDMYMKLWQLDREGGIQLNAHFKPIESKGIQRTALVFNHDGSLVSTVDTLASRVEEVEKIDAAKWTIKIWDVVSGDKVQSFTGSTTNVVSIAFHPGGSELASVTSDDRIHIWDTPTGKQKYSFKVDTPSPYTLTYSPDGKWLMAGGWGIVRMIDTQSWEVRGKVGPHAMPVGVQMAFCPDKPIFVTLDNTQLKFWDIPTGQALSILDGHDSWISCLSFTSDTKRLISSGSDRKVKIWDWERGQELLSLESHRDAIQHLVLTPDQKLITASRDGELRFWDGGARSNLLEEQIEPLTLHSNRIWDLEFLKDGRLVSADEENQLFVWNFERDTAPTKISGAFDVSVSEDQQFMVIANENIQENKLEMDRAPLRPYVLRMLGTQNMVERFRYVHDDNLYWCVNLSPDNRYLIAGTGAGNTPQASLKVFDWQNQSEPWTLGYHEMTLASIEFSPDGKYLATASEDGMIKIWDGQHLAAPQEGRILWPETGYRDVPKIAFDPSGERLASGDGFNDVVVLDVEHAGDPLLRLKGHGDMVICVAYSPNGKYLASAGADQTVRIWDAITGEFLYKFLGHTRMIQTLAFSWDGRLLASAGQDQKIHLWRLDVLPK